MIKNKENAKNIGGVVGMAMWCAVSNKASGNAFVGINVGFSPLRDVFISSLYPR